MNQSYNGQLYDYMIVLNVSYSRTAISQLVTVFNAICIPQSALTLVNSIALLTARNEDSFMSRIYLCSYLNIKTNVFINYWLTYYGGFLMAAANLKVAKTSRKLNKSKIAPPHVSQKSEDLVVRCPLGLQFCFFLISRRFLQVWKQQKPRENKKNKKQQNVTPQGSKIVGFMGLAILFFLFFLVQVWISFCQNLEKTKKQKTKTQIHTPRFQDCWFHGSCNLVFFLFVFLV